MVTTYRSVGALLTIVGLVLAGGAGAETAARPNCPSAFRPYSANSMLIDLLLVPETKAVLAKDEPDLTKVPVTFAALLTPATIPGMSDARAAKLDADLAKLSVTPEAAVIRCARYDTMPPQLPPISGPNAILVFSKTTGFRDDPSIAASKAMLQKIGDAHGWQIVFTENGAVFTPATLRRFKAVVWSNVSGDVLTVPQRQAFRNYIERGGGFIGLHGAGGDPHVDWAWYRDKLIGARFVGHTLRPQFQPAKVIVEFDAGTIAAGLDREWIMTDEWYSFAASPRRTGAHVIARLDEETYARDSTGAEFGNLTMGADHPIAWTRCVGSGRSFYTAIGHLPASYSEAHMVKMVAQALGWTMNRRAVCE